MIDNQTHNQIVSFIWGIADDCLRDVYVRGKYRNVILPMTVIRRLDVVLEDTKEAVLEMKMKLDAAGVANQNEDLFDLCYAFFERFNIVEPPNVTLQMTSDLEKPMQRNR